MKIQIGKVAMDKVRGTDIYPNETRKYLLPCFKEYGEEFARMINDVYKVAVGLGDVIVTRARNFSYQRHLFLLVDTDIATTYFLKLLEWIKNQPMYEDDYVFDNIQKTSYHMFIIKFPEKYYDSIATFKKGKYSKMFNKETIDKFFQAYPDVQKVLIKDTNYVMTFVDKVNKEFKSTIKEGFDNEDWELDFPPNVSSNVFNYHLKK